jgi:hypothetical protein
LHIGGMGHCCVMERCHRPHRGCDSTQQLHLTWIAFNDALIASRDRRGKPSCNLTRCVPLLGLQSTIPHGMEWALRPTLPLAPAPLPQLLTSFLPATRRSRPCDSLANCHTHPICLIACVLQVSAGTEDSAASECVHRNHCFGLPASQLSLHLSLEVRCKVAQSARKAALRSEPTRRYLAG